MSQYIGIDLHKAKSFVTRLNSRGRVLEQVELAHAGGAWLPAAMDEDLAVAVEQQRALLGLIRLGRLSRLPVEVAQ